jgi:hypothetical protein
LAILTLISCRNEKKKNDPDLQKVLMISDCDSLKNNQIFIEKNQFIWPKNKPKSITEAVLLLDKATNEYAKQKFKICTGSEFYFGVGLTMRNEWVRHGDPRLSRQLYEKLKINHPDYSSGYILYFFEKYISDEEISIKEDIGNRLDGDSLKSVKLEMERIQNELNRIKKRRQ